MGWFQKWLQAEEQPAGVQGYRQKERRERAQGVFKFDVLDPSNRRPVLAFFSKPGDDVSTPFAAALEAAAAEAGEAVRFYPVSSRHAEELLADYQITELPAVLIFSQGHVVDRHCGILIEAQARDIVQRAIQLPIERRAAEAKAKRQALAKQAAQREQHEAQRFAQVTAFFANNTNTASFDAARYFTQERITHKDFMPYADKYMPKQQGVPRSGSGFQIAAGLIGTAATAGQAGYLQGFLMSAVPDFRVERTLFVMSEQEREVYRHMGLLCVCGGIAANVYGRFERAIVFNGGNCVFVPTHEPHQYTGLAEQVLKEFLAVRLMPPQQNIHFAIQIFNQVRQAIAAEKAHQALPAGVHPLPKPSNLAEIEKVLDDI